MTAAVFDPGMEDLLAAPAARARELAAISWRQLKYWDLRDLVKPSIRQRVSTAKLVRLYSLDDLIALLVLAQLRNRNIPLTQMRRLVAHLQTQGYRHPLTELTFATHGRQVYIQYPDGSWAGGRIPDQTVIKQVIPLEEIRGHIIDSLRRRAGAPGETEKVRGRMGSKPVFEGTRIPVKTVQRWLENGRSEKEILEAYPDLTVEDIEAARNLMPVSA